MKIHVTVAYYVIVAAFITNVGRGEWCALVLCIALVISLELVNTAIERMCDDSQSGFSPAVRFIKDAAAGAVLVAAIGSAAVGGIVFFTAERVDAMLTFMHERAVVSVILAIVPVAGLWLMMRRRDK